MSDKISTANQERITLLKEIKKHAHAMKRMAMYEAIEYHIDEDIRAIERGKQ
jgi:hypothetical protein